MGGCGVEGEKEADGEGGWLRERTRRERDRKIRAHSGLVAISSTAVL